MRRIPSAACALAALILFAAIEPRQGELRAAEAAPIPIDFIENRGQWDRTISFAARHGPIAATIEHATVRLSSTADLTTAVSLTFESAAPDAAPVGEGRRPTRYNFYIGPDPGRWRSDVPAFAAVAFRHLYPGIDVRLHERARLLEYEVRLDPGAALDRVVLRADGASGLRIEDNGALALDAKSGTLRQSPPVSWEELPGGHRRFVASRFRRIDDHRYGFDVDERDPSRPLVIDPGIVWSTFLGGSGSDFIGPAIAARDGSGDVFVGGTMASADFPSFADPSFAPGVQSPAFVARLGSNGSILRYATFIGGWHA